VDSAHAALSAAVIILKRDDRSGDGMPELKVVSRIAVSLADGIVLQAAARSSETPRRRANFA
jgi:hypothetical protein